MKKSNRIKDNKEFTAVIKTGAFNKSNAFRVYSLENNLGYIRVGVAASRKLGNAVVRSTTRRKIRAICDELINYPSSSLDIVVMPKDPFLEQDHDTNKKELEDILAKIIK